ncbi:MAG: 4Fe-4S dicluster domain-containing protein [Deltaproteobacteria bacterium]|nr:MAG: 4Fe-4S dicluster domain-containing protein [Deltaproteobacteria bacterium]
MSGDRYAELKKGGMMRQAEKGRFSVRLHVVGGRLTSEQVEAIRKASEKYGLGEVHLTARQGVEIPGVREEHLESLKRELREKGVSVGVCGPTVRTVTACQGCRVCLNGVLDSPSLAEQVDREFYGAPVPHKFKVGISGCVNNCLKAEENDVGIKGGVEPAWRREGCTYCGLCAASCPTGAIRVNQEEKSLLIDMEKCIACGDCVKACPFGAMREGRKGFTLYAGGKFGRFPSLGEKVPFFFEDEGQVVEAVRRSIEFFRIHGKKKERFGDTLKRVGFEKYVRFLLRGEEEKEDSGAGEGEKDRHYG